MRKLLIVITFFCLTETAKADDPKNDDNDAIFQMSGNVRVKQFLINREPDQIRLDYRGVHDYADEEIGMQANATVCRFIHIKAYPYFWHSMENQISRVGLIGEVHLGTGIIDWWDDRLHIGYGHHSWHNADSEFKGVGGKSQDWLFAEAEVWKDQYDYDGKTDFSISVKVKPKLFLNNREPSAIRTLYSRMEHKAFATLEVPIDMTFCEDRAELHLKPYWMFSNGMDRYGVWGEFDFKIYKGIWAYMDGQYYRAGSSSRQQLGLGLMLRFN